MFKTYNNKKRLKKTGKNPQNYQVERRESFEHEQKSIEIDIFNDKEEKEIRKRVELSKKKRQEVAEKNKALKRQKKLKKENKKRLSYGSG